MTQISMFPKFASNLTTGLSNESAWQHLESLSPKNYFNEYKNKDDVTSFIYFSDFKFDFQESKKKELRLSGIEVKILRKGDNVKDYWVDLVFPINGDQISLTKNNKAQDNLWPYIYTDISYGGFKDKWNRKWSLDEINSDVFGIVVSSKATKKKAEADIKRVEITIHYHELKLYYNKKEL
ncbi:MAG: hypothetical protein AB7O73_13740 [Bacteroidia bacterium]